MANPTDRAQIGRTDLKVTQLGLGTTPIGNLLSEVPETDAQDAFSAAFATGVRNAEEFKENEKLFKIPIPGQLWDDLKTEGLLADDVPVPADQGSAQ